MKERYWFRVYFSLHLSITASISYGPSGSATDPDCRLPVTIYLQGSHLFFLGGGADSPPSRDIEGKHYCIEIGWVAIFYTSRKIGWTDCPQKGTPSINNIQLLSSDFITNQFSLGTEQSPSFILLLPIVRPSSPPSPHQSFSLSFP